MFKPLIKRLLRNRIIYDYLRSAYLEARVAPSSVAGSYGVIPEITPIGAIRSPYENERLNLVVPALSLQHFFGGINTAIDIFQELTKGYQSARIILSDQSKFCIQDNPSFSTWSIRSMDDDDQAGFHIIPAGDRYGKSLPVARGDRFMATAWWTAVLVKSLRANQSEFYGSSDPTDRFIYLIQDFEPGFYPWSSRYALAESTYHFPDNFVPVFNSSLLRNFFADEGYCFAPQYSFEPQLNDGLRRFLEKSNCPRKKQILVYGRPGVERNAFDLIVMGLREWVSRGAGEEWQFLSAGQSHDDVDLGRGHMLKSLGKLTLDNYAEKLCESSIGISMMVSPHPSYPPLEMAAFGVRVITNCFRTKNLSLLSGNIHSLKILDPVSIADALEFLSQRHDENRDHGTAWMKDYVSGTQTFTQICQSLLLDIGHSAIHKSEARDLRPCDMLQE